MLLRECKNNNNNKNRWMRWNCNKIIRCQLRPWAYVGTTVTASTTPWWCDGDETWYNRNKPQPQQERTNQPSDNEYYWHGFRWLTAYDGVCDKLDAMKNELHDTRNACDHYQQQCMAFHIQQKMYKHVAEDRHKHLENKIKELPWRKSDTKKTVGIIRVLL